MRSGAGPPNHDADTGGRCAAPPTGRCSHGRLVFFSPFSVRPPLARTVSRKRGRHLDVLAIGPLKNGFCAVFPFFDNGAQHFGTQTL